MLSYDEALERVLASARLLGRERVELAEADGRVLAEPLVARAALPAFDYSAMDGYALFTGDLSGGGAWELPVRGESRAGDVSTDLEAGTARRIFTGAALPRGADGVVIQEEVERAGAIIRLSAKPSPWENVRRSGEDLRPGDVALAAGTRLGPHQLALAAALDRTELSVAARPRVAILSTGDELRAPGSAERPGAIPESNSIAIACLARRAGGSARVLPSARDDEALTVERVRAATGECDLLVTIGGVSVGDHDVVRSALIAAGAELDFWKVRIKPGKPLVFGRASRCLVLGLPGNPTSAQITFSLFGLPLLRALQGDRKTSPFARRMRLAKAIRQRPGRRGFYRARLVGQDLLEPLANQASGAPTGMAWADALVIVPEDSPGFSEGDAVDALVLSDL
jgi:molybdopterin molybdotransferase